jgi:hypothetical protein
MYVNGKLMLKLSQECRDGVKENGGGFEFKYYIFDIL